VRLAGQDSRRGTFSQRHAALVDFHTGDDYLPLSALTTDSSELWIYDSLLSEYAALGFEYGYSVENKDALVMWEAQFGRLRQRRLDHHRPVPGGRRGQVEADLRPGAAATPRIRRPGPRAQLGPHRTVPHPGRRGQHPAVQRHDGSAVLPLVAPSDPPGRQQAADHLHTEEWPAGQDLPVTGRRFRVGSLPRADPRRVRPRPRVGHPVGAGFGQGRPRCDRKARRAGRADGGRPG
jgi:hypothetical protein